MEKIFCAILHKRSLQASYQAGLENQKFSLSLNPWKSFSLLQGLSVGIASRIIRKTPKYRYIRAFTEGFKKGLHGWVVAINN